MRARYPLIPMLLLAPLLTAGKCKKKTPDDEPDDVGIGDVSRPEVELQVISIDPDHVSPGEMFTATLFGAGFERGARVWIGETELQRVVVQDENTAEVSAPGLPAGRYDVRVVNPNGDQSTLRGGLLVEAGVSISADCSLVRVSFAFDSSSLDAEAQRSLSSRSACWTQATGQIKVDGHCDERGTTEYNLALGSRRAAAVERWLVSQGVPPSRIRTVSYGEERPLNKGHDERAWAENRRAEIAVVE